MKLIFESLAALAGSIFGVNKSGTSSLVFILSSLLRLFGMLVGLLLILAGIFLEQLKNDAIYFLLFGSVILLGYLLMQIFSTRNFIAGRSTKKE